MTKHLKGLWNGLDAAVVMPDFPRHLARGPLPSVQGRGLEACLIKLARCVKGGVRRRTNMGMNSLQVTQDVEMEGAGFDTLDPAFLQSRHMIL